ncbi:hypothetical protein ACEXQD_17445 [Herbiconiux sp. P15]|uniref:hypothetical protein n=1 Tax=Herbiconiux liukaitaii TaxID=3342799 RepID=UPI0035B72540
MNTRRMTTAVAGLTIALISAHGVAPMAHGAEIESPPPARVDRGDGTAELDPGTIALCNAGLGDVSVKSYDTAELGKIDLFCGDSASGYVHIRDRHEGAWQAQLDSLGGGTNWDDWMEYQVASAVMDPASGYPIYIGDDKACFTAPIEIVNSYGDVEDTFYPTVIVSMNNKKVITAIPTTDKVANNCVTAE